MELNSYILPKYPREIQNSAGISDDKTNAIFFQNFPKVGDDAKTANYNSPDTPIGRGEEFKFYKNTGSRQITIEATFAAIDETYDEAWVQRQAYRLRALVEPIYERDNISRRLAGKFYAPPLCLFTYGERYVNLPIVIDNVTVAANDAAMITSGFEAGGTALADGTLVAGSGNRSYKPAQGLPQVINVSIQATTAYPYGYVPGYLDYLNYFESGSKQPNFGRLSQLGSNKASIENPPNISAASSLPPPVSVLDDIT